MLNIHSFTFNAFQENTYIIENDIKQCWIIDPGMNDTREKEQLIQFIEGRQLAPQAIINTHAHIDHILGVPAIIEQYKIPFGIHEAEQAVLHSGPVSASIFGFDFPVAPKPDFFIQEGVVLKLGGDELQVFHTPGHSPGSLSFYYPKGGWVISGDVLFEGSIGRSDLPGGNYDTLLQSINAHLLTLPDETRVFSGHGAVTSIGRERKENPFLQ